MKRFLIFLFLTLSFQVHGNEISQLLTECQKHFKANRLTTGHKTAFVCYKEVLKKDSNNAKALAGLKKIENRYVYWARRALARGQEKKVQQYLSCLRLVNPKSSKLLEFMPAEISKAQTEIKPIPVKITLKPLQVIPIPVKETKP
ncbi:MAG: hypothetical protein KAI17_04880, partial [Thiotrichaceae bacterium]|nr:hypothetical protein [Thiotrichaceae bacterium]